MITLAGPASNATPINPSPNPAARGNHRDRRRTAFDPADRLTGSSTTPREPSNVTYSHPSLIESIRRV
jgi:hypothetical protein